MMPGDRLVCAFIKPQAAGATFSRWCLHVTIVPWFRLPDSSEDIARRLAEALTTIGPFKAVGGAIAPFRSRGNRQARLLSQPTPFTVVEQKVRAYLHKKRAWLVDETTKKSYAFRPHVTAQGENKLGEGERFAVDKIYIVEQKGSYKQIAAEVKL